jgi:DNA-binding HxlR family transcriptional regulator/putative sterol carrier protein
MEPEGLTISSDRFKLTTTGDDPMDMDSIISELQTFTRRTYGQYCGVSRALEVVGERWGLLIVRDLLVSPRTVGALHRGLPMVPPELLVSRLDELERTGVVRHQAGTDVYELTDYGYALEEAVLALGRWGQKSMNQMHPEEIVTAEALIIGLKASYQPEAARGVHASYEVRVGDLVIHMRIDDGHLKAVEGPDPSADLALDGGYVLRELVTGELTPYQALTQGSISITGDPTLLQQFVKIFHMPEMPGPEL